MNNAPSLKPTLILLTATLLAAPFHVAGREFDFKDPKGVHTIAFILDSTLEPIMGLASDISGKVYFDPKKPDQLTGKITVQSASLHIENGAMKKILHNSDWMDVENHPTIEFTFSSVEKVEPLGEGRFRITATGDFTCRGITQPITVAVVVTYLPDMLGRRLRGQSGDILVLRTEFTIKRTDYGIKPDMKGLIVADEIQLRVAIVGSCPKTR